MSNNNIPDKSNKNNGKSFSKPYLVFVILFAVIAVVTAIIIIKTGFQPDVYKPTVNPFYTENVNYPPKGTEKIGFMFFLAALLVYFIMDCFFGYKLTGWKKNVFIVVSVFVVIFAVEFSMDLYVKKNPPLHKPHPTFLWELYPGKEGKTFIAGKMVTMKINRYGFRGPEIEKKKPSGVYRIMILGDSSAFGFAVNQDEVFASVLQKKLKDEYPAKKIEVVNAAVMGYTTFSTLNFFREKGIEFNPDLIIISHNNDPDFDLDEDKNRVPPKFLQPIMKILYKSKIYMAIRREILNRKYQKTPEIYGKIKPSQGVSRVSPGDLRKNLQAIMDIAKKIDSKILVISMPRNEKFDLIQDEEPVDDDEDGIPIVYDGNDEPSDFDELSLYRGIMKEVTEKNGGIFVDILNEWKDLPPDPLFIDSMHPTVKGHKKIGDRLFFVIREKLPVNSDK